MWLKYLRNQEEYFPSIIFRCIFNPTTFSDRAWFTLRIKHPETSSAVWHLQSRAVRTVQASSLRKPNSSYTKGWLYTEEPRLRGSSASQGHDTLVDRIVHILDREERCSKRQVKKSSVLNMKNQR
ncbi:hypothetical protein ILYODFUR_015116 [Ilyodon furcidens]|uniref:Uncharacterized protein n=1 Tax=Ilyodon furcidens TaxID=33524 RepID=A0ABV0UKD7_9TELE